MLKGLTGFMLNGLGLCLTDWGYAQRTGFMLSEPGLMLNGPGFMLNGPGLRSTDRVYAQRTGVYRAVRSSFVCSRQHNTLVYQANTFAIASRPYQKVGATGLY